MSLNWTMAVQIMNVLFLISMPMVVFRIIKHKNEQTIKFENKMKRLESQLDKLNNTFEKL